MKKSYCPCQVCQMDVPTYAMVENEEKKAHSTSRDMWNSQTASSWRDARRLSPEPTGREEEAPNRRQSSIQRKMESGRNSGFVPSVNEEEERISTKSAESSMREFQRRLSPLNTSLNGYSTDDPSRPTGTSPANNEVYGLWRSFLSGATQGLESPDGCLTGSRRKVCGYQGIRSSSGSMDTEDSLSCLSTISAGSVHTGCSSDSSTCIPFVSQLREGLLTGSPGESLLLVTNESMNGGTGKRIWGPLKEDSQVVPNYVPETADHWSNDGSSWMSDLEPPCDCSDSEYCGCEEDDFFSSY